MLLYESNKNQKRKSNTHTREKAINLYHFILQNRERVKS